MSNLDGILKDVLLKSIGGNIHDMVLIVNELPESLFYILNYPRVPKLDRDGYPSGDLIRDRKSPKTSKELKPGITASQTGDGGFVFDTMTNAGEERFAEVSAHIRGLLPRDVPIPQMIPYAVEPGTMSSPPLQRHQIPRVELPVSSPPVEAKASTVQASPSNLQETPKKRGRPAKIRS